MIQSHVVQPGEGLFAIAAKLAPSGITLEQRNTFAMAIAVANGGDFSVVLHPGRILWFDTATIPAAPEPEPEPEPDPDPDSGDRVRPGPHNTGPSNPAALVDVTASQVAALMAPGAVIENVRIRGGLRIDVPDVTIRNFVLDANGSSYGVRATSSGLLLEDGEILNMGSAAVYGMGFTARRLNVHDSDGDGFKAQGSNPHPVLVESCWIHRLGRAAGSHADGNQSRSGGAPIVFRGNYFDMPTPSKAPELEGAYRSNAAFMIQSGADGPLASFTAEDNWLDGGNYTVYASGDPTEVVFRRNRFGRRYNFGVRSIRMDAVWEGNVWDDTDEPIP